MVYTTATKAKWQGSHLIFKDTGGIIHLSAGCVVESLSEEFFEEDGFFMFRDSNGNMQVFPPDHGLTPIDDVVAPSIEPPVIREFGL
jgi:hypothetical protein